MRVSPHKQMVDRGLEFRLRCHLAVKSVAGLVVVVLTPRTPTERRAKEHVTDATCFHCGPQMFAVEVRREFRVRVRTHIDEELDALAGNQCGEAFDVVVGVPDGPYRGVRGHRLMLCAGPDVKGVCCLAASMVRLWSPAPPGEPHAPPRRSALLRARSAPRLDLPPPQSPAPPRTPAPSACAHPKPPPERSHPR